MRKVCRRCDIEKPLDDFHNWKLGKDGKQHWCKACMNAQRKKHYEEHFDELREERNARSQRWRDNNPGANVESQRRFREANVDKCRTWTRENQSRRRAQTAATRVDYEAILERDGLWCYLCESEVEPNDIHFDHVVPLSKGGEHSMENIRVTHSRCNLSKGDRLLEEAA